MLLSSKASIKECLLHTVLILATFLFTFLSNSQTKYSQVANQVFRILKYVRYMQIFLQKRIIKNKVIISKKSIFRTTQFEGRNEKSHIIL